MGDSLKVRQVLNIILYVVYKMKLFNLISVVAFRQIIQHLHVVQIDPASLIEIFVTLKDVFFLTRGYFLPKYL